MPKLLRGLLVVPVLLLTACDPRIWYGAAIAVPILAELAHHEGGTLTIVSQSPSAVAVEYSHAYANEYGAAFKRAEQLCTLYGRHARSGVEPVKLSMDRSLATFDCVQ